MILKEIRLQNFRSYTKAHFKFADSKTVIIGPNTSGKTNLIEAIFLLSSGESFKTDKDIQMLKFQEQVGRVKGELDDIELEVILSSGEIEGRSPSKKYLVNGLPRRRGDFAGYLPAVIFSPQDLEIIISSPSIRRNFLDKVLEQTDREYRYALISYTKAIRQRNSLLERARDEGRRELKQFEYWDRLVIDNGQIITNKRRVFIGYVNSRQKEIFDFEMKYDLSEISRERLNQYEREEVASGVTLVGPHRDDFSLSLSGKDKNRHHIKYYGSRGQQRLAVLQLKVLELSYMKETLSKNPILILDDIFSELDASHIKLVLEMSEDHQTILTTTHREFIPSKLIKSMEVIELGE